MAYATKFPERSPANSFVSSLAGLSRIVITQLFTGIGAVAAIGACAAIVVVAAGWVVLTAISGHSGHRAMPAMGLREMALADPRFVFDNTDVTGSPRFADSAAGPAAEPHVTPAAEPSR